MDTTPNIHIGGNVSGTNVAVGSNIKIKQIGVSGAELAALLQTFRNELERAPLPESTRAAIKEDVMPALESAAKSSEPKTKLEEGLGKLNLVLKSAGAAAEQVTGIASVGAKIAKAAGIAFATAAPWLARFVFPL